MSFLSKAWNTVSDFVAPAAASIATGNPSPMAAAGINLLGDVAGNVWNNANAISAAQRDYRYAKDLMDYQNEYNKPVNQMARYKEAGLNPNLIYGQSNLSASGSASASPARVANPQLRIMEYNKDRAMIENMHANNENIRQQNLNLQAQNGLLGAQQAEVGVRMAESLARAKQIGAQTRGTEIENRMRAYDAGYSEAQYRSFLKNGEIPRRYAGMSKAEQYRDDVSTNILKYSLDAVSNVINSAVDKLYKFNHPSSNNTTYNYYNSNNRTNTSTSNSYTDSSSRSQSNVSNNAYGGYRNRDKI